MKPGTKLKNGAIVLDAKPYKRESGLLDAHVVLAINPGSSVQPFASWVVINDTLEATWGHYTENLSLAVGEYEERVRGCVKAGKIGV